MQFSMFLILGQANPRMSQMGWILSTQSSMSAILVLVSAAAIFAGACYLVKTQRTASALAAYLVLLPLPCLISLCGWISGSAASLSVIAVSPNITLSRSDIAAGLADSLMGLLIAFMVSAPTYVVLAYGLLSRTMQRPMMPQPTMMMPGFPGMPPGTPVMAPPGMIPPGMMPPGMASGFPGGPPQPGFAHP